MHSTMVGRFILPILEEMPEGICIVSVCSQQQMARIYVILRCGKRPRHLLLILQVFPANMVRDIILFSRIEMEIGGLHSMGVVSMRKKSFRVQSGESI